MKRDLLTHSIMTNTGGIQYGFMRRVAARQQWRET